MYVETRDLGRGDAPLTKEAYKSSVQVREPTRTRTPVKTTAPAPTKTRTEAPVKYPTKTPTTPPGKAPTPGGGRAGFVPGPAKALEPAVVSTSSAAEDKPPWGKIFLFGGIALGGFLFWRSRSK